MGLGLPGNDSSVMVDPPQALTRAVRDRHLHCPACLDGVDGDGLCRPSLFLQRLEPACLNFIHNMFLQKDWGGFFSCDKSLCLYFVLTCTRVWNRIWFCLEALVTMHLDAPGHWTFTNTEKRKNLESEVSFCMVGQVSSSVESVFDWWRAWVRGLLPCSVKILSWQLRTNGHTHRLIT